MRGALILAAAALAATSASAQETAPDRSQDPAWHYAQQRVLLDYFASGEWRLEEGGLLWRRVAGDGIGPKPTVSDTVTVHYAGKLTDGTQFDSSYDRGEPAKFPLGRLIPAWQIAIPHMAVGDKIELAVPSSMAYGPEGRRTIPPNATLIFTVELLGIGDSEEE